MTRKRAQVLTPCESRTTNQLCSLGRDNVSWGDYWLIIDEVSVAMAQQKAGEMPVGSVQMPRHVFERFARWYLTGSMKLAQNKRRAKETR
jgi:hypothetical protein